MICSTPLKDGYSFPAEYQKHNGTVVMLPYRSDVWKNGGKEARDVFFEMVKIISKYENVYIILHPSISFEKKRFSIPNATIIEMLYDDSWARDIMPSFVVKNGDLRIVDFRFNAWGGSYDGLYEDYRADDECKRNIAKHFSLEYYHLEDFVLEGGSFHVDEYGTLLTTEACLLSEGRNRTYSREQIVNVLKEYLGVKKVVFIPHGIYNDETNEHVDNVACFVRRNIIALAWSDNRDDMQYQYAREAYRVLSNETNAIGEHFEIVKFPTPIIYATDDDVKGIEINETAKKRLSYSRLAASYINYYIGNGFLLFPQFNVKEDAEALKLIKELYHNYDVYPIYSREILIAGGNIHCVTQQVPGGK